MNYINLLRRSRPLVYLALLAITLTAALPVGAAQAPARTNTLPPITVAGRQLMREGVAFEIRGVNYIRPTGSPTACPELHFAADPRCPWQIELIDADMERLRALGVNTIRVFLNYYVFGGARAQSAGYSLATPLAHLDALIASANSRGIYVLPVLLAKFPQDQLTIDGLRGPLYLHVAPVVSRLAGNSGVLALDLFNEPDIGSPIDERCWDWDNGDFPLCAELTRQRVAFLTQLYYEVKWLDRPRLLTIGMGFAKSYSRPTAVPSSLAGLVDFYSFHYYDDAPYDSGRYAAHWYYGQGLPRDLQRGIDELHALGQDKPVVVTEFGFPTGEGERRDEALLRSDLRLGLATARTAGAAGVMLWPFQSTPEAVVGDLFIDSLPLGAETRQL